MSSMHPLRNSYNRLNVLLQVGFIIVLLGCNGLFPACEPTLLFANIRPTQEVLLIPAQTQTKDEAEEIQAVLSSEAFSGSPNLARLLKYLCSNHFSENRST